MSAAHLPRIGTVLYRLRMSHEVSASVVRLDDDYVVLRYRHGMAMHGVEVRYHRDEVGDYWTSTPGYVGSRR